jgi:hypothetical protein
MALIETVHPSCYHTRVPNNDERAILRREIENKSNELLEVQDLIKETEEKLRSLQANESKLHHEIFRRRAASSLVRRLDVKTLRKIFEYYVQASPSHVRRLLLVNKTWKKVAHGYPNLWTDIQIGFDGLYEATLRDELIRYYEACAVRSAGLPLYIRVNAWMGEYTGFADAELSKSISNVPANQSQSGHHGEGEQNTVTNGALSPADPRSPSQIELETLYYSDIENVIYSIFQHPSFSRWRSFSFYGWPDVDVKERDRSTEFATLSVVRSLGYFAAEKGTDLQHIFLKFPRRQAIDLQLHDGFDSLVDASFINVSWRLRESYDCLPSVEVLSIQWDKMEQWERLVRENGVDWLHVFPALRNLRLISHVKEPVAPEDIWPTPEDSDLPTVPEYEYEQYAPKYLEEIHIWGCLPCEVLEGMRYPALQLVRFAPNEFGEHALIPRQRWDRLPTSAVVIFDKIPPSTNAWKKLERKKGGSGFGWFI